jgi:hypothetical protein
LDAGTAEVGCVDGDAIGVACVDEERVEGAATAVECLDVRMDVGSLEDGEAAVGCFE